MEVTRIASMGGSSKGNKRVGSLCSFGRVLYTPQVLLSCWCSLLLLMGDVSRCLSVCGLSPSGVLRTLCSLLGSNGINIFGRVLS